MDTATLKPGDKVWRWWETIPGIQADPQILTVVRVNRITVTVRTGQGNTFRLPHHRIEGRWTEED